MKRKEFDKSEEESFFEKNYLVERGTGGSITVTEQSSGNQFFRTNAGGWFFLMGPNSPFGEDVELIGWKKDYLDGIVAAAGLDLKHHTKDKDLISD